MALPSHMDPREQAAYPIAEAARYLGLPQATLRAWTRGQKQGAKPAFKPLLKLPQPNSPLSFMNLVEAHVLSALRRQHNVTFQKIRAAVAYLQRRYPSRHPLADHKFATDGVDVFIDKFGELINLHEPEQVLMREMFSAYLSRIDRDAHGVAIKLYPFSRRGDISDPKSIEIDPAISFGRPSITGTGIPTAVIAERYKAGESIAEIAEDYHRRPSDIEEAIRCELNAA